MGEEARRRSTGESGSAGCVVKAKVIMSVTCWIGSKIGHSSRNPLEDAEGKDVKRKQ